MLLHTALPVPLQDEGAFEESKCDGKHSEATHDRDPQAIVDCFLFENRIDFQFLLHLEVTLALHQN